MKYIEKTSWSHEKELIAKLNKPLFEAISRLDPPEDIPLYKLRYSFGDRIKLDGEFYVLNNSAENVPLGDKSIDKSIRDDLTTESQMPIGLMVSKSVELYVDYEDRVIPFNLFKPGMIFGINAALKPEASFELGNFWQMTAGCRSAFLTSKLSEHTALARITQEFGLPLERPQGLLDHWHLFKKICEAGKHQWYAEVIFFPKQWHENKEDLKWKEFRLFLFETVWSSSSLRMNSYLLDLSYSKLASTCKNIVPNLYINRLVRHIMMMAIGACPGFKFLTTDEEIPYNFLREVLITIYRLKNNEPTFLGLDKLLGSSCNKIYYALAVPTIAEFTLSNSKESKRTTEISEAFRMMASLRKNRHDVEFSTSHKQMFDTFLDASIIGYHVNNMASELPIQDPSELLKNDANLIELLKRAKTSGRTIYTNSPVFSGLIEISKR